MPYIAPPFTPTVTISGTDLIRNTDEKLQTIADEVGTYLETETQAVYDDLSLRVTDLETDYNTVLKPEIEQKMDDLLTVNPDGTYYTKSAIDALVNDKVSKVTSTDNAISRFNGTTGAIQNSGVVVDDSGNVGIGVTPSAWTGTLKGIEFGYGNSIMAHNGDAELYQSTNTYRGSTGWFYKNSTQATMHQAAKGVHAWFTAPSGTAGYAITWTTALIIPSTGGIQLPNTAIANATTLDWYEEATATLTATGMTTSPTGTGIFTRNGNTVTLTVPTISGTSNATTFTLTGIPINFRPSASRGMLLMGTDNNINTVINGVLDTGGTITLYPQTGTNGWSSSGTKATKTMTIIYHI